ncbi:uncharacterized protein LOC102714582 [Oryza brachyantha]|uniref:Uncharacterized protein n=1 Tax=Oryza brachyantha TaxID=4533 RepID=J3MUV0_ORYBR|nr:uncharacterized protein LOC102714582 [Oryza brachyantha]
MKKMRKVAEFLRKAVGALRGKASVLRARLLFLASLRRRTAVVGAISHHLRGALMPGSNSRESADGRGEAPLTAPAGDEADDDDVGLSELASLFEEVDDDDADGRYPDWTHSLFDDDDDGGGGDEDVDEELREEASSSVMEVIRRRREGEGEEFNMEEEIDHAADMFIRRVRSRMAANRRSFKFTRR